MGIYERDYVRNPPQTRGFGGGFAGGGFGLSAMRMWSVNTWLIAICVAIFMIDGFLPPRLVQMSDLAPVAGVSEVPSDLVVVGWNDETLDQLPLNGQKVLAVVDPQTNQQVGSVLVQKMQFLQSLFHFSTERGFLKIEFWRFIGFQFLHFNLSHLLFNMIGLFFFGPLVEKYLGSKRYLAFYLLCGMCGSFMYLLLNLGALITSSIAPDITLPLLLFNSEWSPLIGASAGVFGVLIAGAHIVPNATAMLFFVIPMKLKTLAYLMVGIAFFTLFTSGNNAGGEAAHIGGALAGFYFIRHPRHLHNFFDVLGRVDPTSHHYRKDQPVRRRGHDQPPSPRPRRSARIPSEQQIDAILDKIRREGTGSLTEKEKKTLRDASAD